MQASARPEADTIQWHEGMNYNAAVSASAAAEGVATSKKRPREDDGESGSFFDWFSHIGDDDDSVGEAIKEIWIDPMQYYHGSWQANTGGEMDAGDGNELAEEDITGDGKTRMIYSSVDGGEEGFADMPAWQYLTRGRVRCLTLLQTVRVRALHLYTQLIAWYVPGILQT